ncbi:hypothetical protein CYLTODRAFT_52648 [Cylindrobasidium torrendii FP15055 ss-10]|uniref:C2H2-type domain-containing protein n=1 Tax=Cylindrobasidium torrendii FP15055 ss-10 TaxID=1314674 RepID=A0A0D7B5K7_9AGAR|nr:hypothetical protein CYLTODRAFT_52648 [Cylindrobasidium torrendii FP15055 ss-10]
MLLIDIYATSSSAPPRTPNTVMSTTSLYACFNPACDKVFTVHGHLLSHCRQATTCSWWLEHAKEVRAGKQREGPVIVPGSIHDMTAAHFAADEEDEDDAMDQQQTPVSTSFQGQDVPMDEPAASSSAGDQDVSMEPPADDDEEAEDAARERLLADWIDKQAENDELFNIAQPDLAIGQPGPGPTTLHARLGRMVGARARFFEGEGDEDGGRPDDIIEEHPTAGAVLSMSPQLYEHWDALFGTDRLPQKQQEGSSGAPDLERRLYHPFASQIDWEVAHWMVSEGIGHGSFNRLLKIKGVRECLGLSYKNTAGLHERVDAIPRRAGKWYDKHISFPDRPDEIFVLRHRDIIECIRSLWGDPELSEHIVYKPKKIFQQDPDGNDNKGSRLYNEMWTGEWWWFIQDRLPAGHTLAPIILATDKTQLTQFSGSKQAYPIYLTLGNIPSSLRRKPSQQACILVGYLPIEKVGKTGLTQLNAASRPSRVFHAAMRHLLEPLIDAGKKGIEMTGGDGSVRLVHPILAAYVSDYPEQCLVTCSKSGTCPKCQCGANNLDSNQTFPVRTQKTTLDAMADAKASSSSQQSYYDACMARDINGYVTQPFWEDLPFTDIHLAETPDILHQVYQGVVAHLVDWCQVLATEKELDRRIRRLPPALGLRHFKNGLAGISQLSGSERKDIGKILLGCIVNLLPTAAVTAVRAILDFIYLAQYTTHDDATLSYMEDALNLWDKNKDIFIRTGIRDDLNIPKFHSLRHYMRSIRLFGVTNNFNTELFERLHIEFAKKGWRASNHRDEFPQMTQWVTRQENIHSFK